MTTTLTDLDQNLHQCWRCSHCKWVPAPASHRFSRICPSVEWGNFHTYSGGGKLITAYALSRDAVPYSAKTVESVFACTMCGGCDIGCKSNNAELIELQDVLYALRAKMAADGQNPPEHLAMIDSLRAHGNPFGKPAADRATWADGLGLRDATRESVEVLLHIGCDNAYSRDYWPELRAIIGLLTQAKVDFGIAFAAERTTGEAAFDLGFQDDAREQAAQMAALIAATGSRRIVTCSAGSYSAFRTIWPRLRVAPPAADVTHSTAFVEELFAEGRLQTAGTFEALATYHDSCRLGRLSEPYRPSDAKWIRVLNNLPVHDPVKPIPFGNDGLYDAPRRLLARISGVTITEMERNRESVWCCGGKAGAPEAYPEFAVFAARERMAEARATKAELVVTASCACQKQLAAAREDGAPQVIGLFSLIAAATAPIDVARAAVPARS